MSKNGVSAKLIHYIYKVLKQALDQAVKWNMIPENPSKDIPLPTYRKKEKVLWKDSEASKFIEAIQGHPMELIFLLYAATGCRRGEVLALTWDCVDFDHNGIVINKSLSSRKVINTTKTEGSDRFVSLPSEIMNQLRAHQIDQSAKFEKIGFENSLNAVFLSSHLTLYYPKNVLDSFKRLCRTANVPVINIHALRHLQASWLIADGLDIKTIQNRLGHTRAQTTLDIYGHMLNRQQQVAAHVISNKLSNLSSKSESQQNNKIIDFSSYHKKSGTK